MKILIAGGGGREHALAWKCAQSDLVTDVYVAPGNAGTDREQNVSNVNIPSTNPHALAEFAKEQRIDFTIIGPEQSLATGVVNVFQEKGLRCFGPSKQLTELETSKVYAKTLLRNLQIPTARFNVFTNNDFAAEYIWSLTPPFVVKPDGLTGGKGVVVAHTVEQGLTAAYAMLVSQVYGQAGARILIEEFIPGEEVSFIACVNGKNVIPLVETQDYKLAGTGNIGGNTGGMGAYSPVPFVDPVLRKTIMDDVMVPLVSHLEECGMPYVGFLYAGLKVHQGVPYVLELNVRLGDPEGQVILLRMKSDLVRLLTGDLTNDKLEWNTDKVVGVVAVSRGYPEQYDYNYRIYGLEDVNSDRVKVFHNNTQLYLNNSVFSSGGRVLTVCGFGPTFNHATASAYHALHNVLYFDNVSFRDDIGAHLL